MGSGDRAVEIGDRCNNGWPGVAQAITRVFVITAIPAARMKAQGSPCRTSVMPRRRKYDCATVPVIGFDIANRRRAASGDPVGTGAAGRLSA